MVAVNSFDVELTMLPSPSSGTNDTVYFDIGTRQWQINKVDRDDLERGETDRFELDLDSPLDTDDIRETRISKSCASGWLPSRIGVLVDGKEFYPGAVGIIFDQGHGAARRTGAVWEATDLPARGADRAVLVTDIVVGTNEGI